MKSSNRRENVRRLFEELTMILQNEGEENWCNGVVAALKCLDSPDIEAGYDEAKSIYRTMISGSGTSSDYYIQREDPLRQAEANRRLDIVRDELWQLFQEE